MMKNRKKTYMNVLAVALTVVLATAVPRTVHAAKAMSAAMKCLQPDGKTVTVMLNGDEDCHWYSTTDGVILVRIGGAFCVANVDGSGEIVSTGIVAHDKTMRSVEEIEAATAQNRTLFFSAMQTKAQRQRRKEPIGTGSPSYFPHTGSPKAVVILAEFTDCKFLSDNRCEEFDLLFNATEKTSDLFGSAGKCKNWNSIRQYFSDMSDGVFTPEFTVVGPVSLPQTMSYYGGSSSNNYVERPQQLMSDAIAAAASDYGIDFSSSDYDNDGDGVVDMVFVIHAGYGENTGGPSESVWAKSGAITGITPISGVKFGRYCMTAELNFYETYWTGDTDAGIEQHNEGVPALNGIGVVCHEFSHAMGLPDTYPTSTAARIDNQEMEYWDLMDGGEYTGNGYRPTAYTAWEREAMGWFEIETLAEDVTNLTITPVLSGGKAYRILNDADNTEYFVLENIQKKGWNGAMFGHGLLVYHVNWPTTTVSLSNSINNTPGKPNMAVVPADGALLSSYIAANKDNYAESLKGDPFPGSQNVTALNNTLSLPNFTWYNGDATVNIALANITENTETGIVTFDFISDFATDVKSISVSDKGDSDIFSLDGRCVGNSVDMLPSGIYVRNGKVFVKK